jgi:hypothetical protein
MHDDNELPMDYAPCAECGFDHAYEPENAHEAHVKHNHIFTINLDVLMKASPANLQRLASWLEARQSGV